MRHAYYLLNDEHEPVPVDMLTWAEWFEIYENRKVALDQIGLVTVSTVFLGLDHSFGDSGPPVLFETMIFHKGEERGQYRSFTWDGAIERHNSIVQFLLAGVAPEHHRHADHSHDDTHSHAPIEKTRKKKR